MIKWVNLFLILYKHTTKIEKRVIMHIRQTKKNEIPEVMKVIEYGRQLQRKNGNNIQWPNHYPAASDIETDILNNHSYVCVIDGQDQTDLPEETIVATMCIQSGEDPTYQDINGEWLNDRPYVTIHRIASNQQIKGAGSFCMQYVIDNYDNIKIDTHQKNTSMIALIDKFGFEHCGDIIIQDGTPREVFQYSK